MNRLCYIDCLRVFACFLVVTIHCNYIPTMECNKIYTQLLNVIGSPSSELFLAISGCLLIPVKISQGEFYRKRFSKLFVGTTIQVYYYWTFLVYVCNNRYVFNSTSNFTFSFVK